MRITVIWDRPNIRRRMSNTCARFSFYHQYGDKRVDKLPEIVDK